MNGELRTERRVGVTATVTPSAARNLFALVHSETWPDLLDVLERCCIEIETILINTDPSEKLKVLENHKLSKAAWVIFETMQDKIIAAGNTYFSRLETQPVEPPMTEEEEERENILNPTYFRRAAVDSDGTEERTI
jgi:L-rhamnose mutarotase